MNNIALAIGMATLVIAAPASAATIVSENFNAGYGVFTVTPNSPIARFAARPGYVNCCGVQGSDAALDNPFVAFGAGGIENSGSIYYDFQTVLGRIYTLSFRYGAFCSGTDNLVYTIFQDNVIYENGVSPVADNNADTTFRQLNTTFIGGGGVARLSFAGNGLRPNVDSLLDDVLLTTPAVPEPATWAMMMLGFGIVGVGLRRRAAKVTTRVAFI